MRRKSLWLSFGLLLLVVSGIVATLVLLARHEPAFYAQTEVPAGQRREELSNKFLTEFVQFIASIKGGGHPETGDWRGCFSEEQLNSYLQEGFLTTGAADKLLPDNISDPRIVFEQNRIRLGFRYGTPPWSTIISVDFRVWLAKHEPNVVVLELQSLHAGALPISAQSLLEEISEALRRNNIQVIWYRHDGNPTAALKFPTDPQHPNQLRQIELRAGSLTVLGHSNGIPR
jgi:hypothetical protein